MTDKVTYNVTAVCEDTGNEHHVSGEIEPSKYARTGQKELENLMLIEVLKQHPSIVTGIELGYSIDAPAEAEQDREDHEEMYG